MSTPPVDSLANPQMPMNPLMPTAPNLGAHRVTDMSKKKGMGQVIEPLKHGAGKLAHYWKTAPEKEKDQYRVAAACAVIAMMIIFVLGFILGLASFSLLAQMAYLPFLGGVSRLRSGLNKSKHRKEWEMPPYPKQIKNIPEEKDRKKAKQEFAHLWGLRIKEKVALDNVRMSKLQKKKMNQNYSREEAIEKKFLKSYEDADVKFWRLAKEAKAYEKIQKFNDLREKRGEPERLTF